MSRKYKFHNPDGVYFVSFSVIEWLDVFINHEYKDIVVDCLNFCIKEKGMELFAWCIMPTHVHLMFRSVACQKPELLLGDLKRFTSKAIVKAIKENGNECRKDWFLSQFYKAGLKSSNVDKYQFWQHHNHPIELWSNKVIFEKINYIHYNPVEAELVRNPYDYMYSSALDYCDKKGLVEGVIVVR